MRRADSTNDHPWVFIFLFPGVSSVRLSCDASTSHRAAAETEWLSLTIALIRINPQSGNTIMGPQQRWARRSVIAEGSETLRHSKDRYWRYMRVKIHLVWAKATFENSFTAQIFLFLQYNITWIPRGFPYKWLSFPLSRFLSLHPVAKRWGLLHLSLIGFPI